MNIVNKISELVTELGGGVMKSKNDTEIIISFNSCGKSIVESLQLKICHSEREFGIVMKSFTTQNKFVSIREWFFLLIEYLETEFKIHIELNGKLCRYYFLGQLENQNKK